MSTFPLCSQCSPVALLRCALYLPCLCPQRPEFLGRLSRESSTMLSIAVGHYTASLSLAATFVPAAPLSSSTTLNPRTGTNFLSYTPSSRQTLTFSHVSGCCRYPHPNSLRIPSFACSATCPRSTLHPARPDMIIINTPDSPITLSYILLFQRTAVFLGIASKF